MLPRQNPPPTLTATFADFVRSEQFGGVLLITCTVASLLLANSPAGPAWFALWQTPLGPLSIEHWINDALMAVFFLLIGLELERELYVGELSRVRAALLPVFAAVGGMLAPAALHLALNAGTPAQAGFGIPMATDIAFALGVLALLGARVPASLKVLVVAFAVIDDLGAIVLIAVAYTDELSMTWLAMALAVFASLMALNRIARVMALTPYLLGGVLLWFLILKAGVHASIAGVLLAFAIPFTSREPGAKSPSHHLEHWLHRPVAWLVLPLFALANTALIIDSTAIESLGSDNSLGIALGLLLGKPLGVVLLCGLAVACRASALPADLRWTHVIGAGLLGGIGFTMSIFITNLAFAGDPTLIAASKLAVLGASTLAGIAALLWLRFAARPKA
jgi:NhaA family Na+:H+ antiporter